MYRYSKIPGFGSGSKLNQYSQLLDPDQELNFENDPDSNPGSKKIFMRTLLKLLSLQDLKEVSSQTNGGSKVGSIDRYWCRTVALEV
jgi:hypothetical protein